MSTCDWGFSFEAMRVCHDTEWGMPVHDDRIMFEYLMLEANRDSRPLFRRNGK